MRFSLNWGIRRAVRQSLNLAKSRNLISVKQHADSWVAIEVETKELARQLDTFTRKFKGAGTQLLAVLSKVSGDRYLTGTIKNLTEEELNELSKIAIESDQKKILR